MRDLPRTPARSYGLLPPKELEPVRDVVARHVPASLGRSTVHRWCTLGIQGLTLPCCRIGRRFFTTDRAMVWWLGELQVGLPIHESPYLPCEENLHVDVG
jgi:hypothetical protein